MSDDDKNGAWAANQGVSLPSGVDATYSAELSPFFIGRTGIVVDWISNKWVHVSNGRGNNGFSWSSNTADTSGWAYYFSVSVQNTLPSNKNSRFAARSLRCLVSTNNG